MKTAISAPDARLHAIKFTVTYCRHFWKHDDQHHFSAATTSLYLNLIRRALLAETISTEIQINSTVMQAKLKIGRPVFTKSIEELKKAGLIEYTPGIGRGNTSIFILVPPAESDQE